MSKFLRFSCANLSFVMDVLYLQEVFDDGHLSPEQYPIFQTDTLCTDVQWRERAASLFTLDRLLQSTIDSNVYLAITREDCDCLILRVDSITSIVEGDAYLFQDILLEMPQLNKLTQQIAIDTDKPDNIAYVIQPDVDLSYFVSEGDSVSEL